MIDNRFGTFKFGTSHQFGASYTWDALAWDISIDWDGDRLFEVNESEHLDSIGITRGRKMVLGNLGAGYQKIQTGRGSIVLNNGDGRFDGWNTASPLYPNVSYGKDVRVRVRDLNGSADPYPLMRGFITDLSPSGYGSDAKVTITISDGLEYLRNNAARVSLQEGITPEAAIGLVLDSVKWPGAWGRSLAPSSDLIDYWWASGDRKAIHEIDDLAQSFLGYFFVSADGEAVYIPRTDVASSVYDYDQSILLKDIGNPQAYDISRNLVRLKVHPRTQADNGIIWQLVGTQPSVVPGSSNSLELFADYTYNNQRVPAKNVTLGAYALNTQADGGGSDMTASCSVTLTDFGDAGKVKVVNNSGVLVYIIQLEIEGEAIYEQNTADITYPKDSSTITNPRELSIDLPWQQDLNTTRDIADVLGPYYTALHPMPSLPIEARPAAQFTPDLFDPVTATISKLGVSGVAFRVGGIEHKSIAPGCQALLTRLYLEPYVSAADFWIWDTASVWDTSTVFGW